MPNKYDPLLRVPRSGLDLYYCMLHKQEYINTMRGFFFPPRQSTCFLVLADTATETCNLLTLKQSGTSCYVLFSSVYFGCYHMVHAEISERARVVDRGH